MAQENEEQIDYWNDEAGRKWVDMQDMLDRQLETFRNLLIERSGIAPGQRVLDIGCGCGATTLAAAEAVGADGFVTGVDVSRPMLAHARSRAETAGVSNVEFVEGDAADHAWGESYDAAISRFGVMFFADPAKAFANIRAALKPGASATFLTWRPLQENPWMMVPLMSVASILELPPPPDPHEPGPFALSDSDRTEKLLSEAGFTEVNHEAIDVKLPLGAGAGMDDAIDFIINGVGPLSRLLKEEPPEKHEEVRAALRVAFEPMQTDEGVVLEFAPWAVSATNP